MGCLCSGPNGPSYSTNVVQWWNTLSPKLWPCQIVMSEIDSQYMLWEAKASPCDTKYEDQEEDNVLNTASLEPSFTWNHDGTINWFLSKYNPPPSSSNFLLTTLFSGVLRIWFTFPWSWRCDLFSIWTQLCRLWSEVLLMNQLSAAQGCPDPLLHFYQLLSAARESRCLQEDDVWLACL